VSTAEVLLAVTDWVGLEAAACECYGKIRRLLPGTFPDAPLREENTEADAAVSLWVWASLPR
jgi:hypothetical protein